MREHLTDAPALLMSLMNGKLYFMTEFSSPVISSDLRLSVTMKEYMTADIAPQNSPQVLPAPASFPLTSTMPIRTMAKPATLGLSALLKQ